MSDLSWIPSLGTVVARGGQDVLGPALHEIDATMGVDRLAPDQRILLAAALEGACRGQSASLLAETAAEIARHGPQLLAVHRADTTTTTTAQRAAWRTVRALATSGAAGAQLAATLTTAQGGAAVDAGWLGALARAATALDPPGRHPFAALHARALSVDRATTPLCQTPAEAASPLPSQFQVANWLSPDALRREGVAADAIRDRVPSIALLALQQQRDGPVGATWSEAQRVAVSAIRNGLTGDLGGSDLAFAQNRVAKLVTYARRLREGPFARLLRSDPLRALTRRDFDRHLATQLGGMRAAKQAAGCMATLNGALLRGAKAAGDVARTETAALDAALYAHWASRNLGTQQLDRGLEPREVAQIVQQAIARIDGPASARESLRERLSARLAGQRLEPARLQEAGWAMVAELRTMAALVASSGREATPDGADRHRASIVLRALADDAEPGSHSSPARLARVADAYRTRLEDTLLRVGGPEPQAHEAPAERGRAVAERANAADPLARSAGRRADPIGVLARAVAGFELGSSFRLSSGRFGGVNLPLGLPTLIASHLVPLPAAALGRIGLLRRREAVISAQLSSNGGEIFVGTARGHDAEAAVGAAGGLAIGPTVVGVGGVVGRTHSRTVGTGLWLRIPRNGTVPARPGPDGRPVPVLPGLEGDQGVAQRMSEVLLAIRDLSARNTPNLLLALMARFPELSVGTTRDPAQHVESHPDRRRIEAGAGVMLPVGVVRTTVAGATATLEADRRVTLRRIESVGRSAVSVRTHPGSFTRFTVGATALGAGRGIAEAVAIRSSLLGAGAIAGSSLTLQDGAHAPASFYTETFDRFGRFRSEVGSAMPQLVDFALTADQRMRALAAAEHDAAATREQRDQATARRRAERADAYMNSIDAMNPTYDSRYVVFSVIRPAAREALDGLHALRNLTQGDPALAGLHAASTDAYEDVATRREAFSAAYAFQVRDQRRETWFGWRIGLDMGRLTRTNWTGVQAVA